MYRENIKLKIYHSTYSKLKIKTYIEEDFEFIEKDT